MTISFSLSEEQQLMQKTARDFAQNEIKPVVEEIEKRDPTKVIPWDLCRDMYRKATGLGFTTLLIPEKYGGQGRTDIDNVILMEELGAVDLGIAAGYFNQTVTSPVILLSGATEAQCDKWLTELCSLDAPIISSAGNEADVAGSDAFCPYPDPKIGMKTYAKRDGDEYVINGSKAAFCTNAGIADYYFVMARTDMTKPAIESTSLFFIPRDTPGLSVGKKTEMIGWKTAQHAEVFLDDVRVSSESLIGEKEGNVGLFFLEALPHLAAGLAACYVGLARAIYEYAFDYAKQRVSWGQPIINHQAVALKLADMYVDTQAARLMVWDLAYAADTRSPQALFKGPAAKTFAVDVAIKNAQSAVKILGAYGVTTEFKTAKYLGDAWVGDSCDGTRDMLRLNMMNALSFM